MKLEFNKPDAVTNFIDSDDSIYHFTKKETAIEHILNNRNLKFGDFKLTNDPREYKRKMTPAVGWGWEDDQLPKISEISNSIDKFIKSSGFLSFCQNNYDNNTLVAHGCLKSRMWSQYGESHSGICLVFSKKQLLQEIENQLSSIYTIYSDSISYIDSNRKRAKGALQVDGQELAEKQVVEIALEYISTKSKEVFFNKQTDYRDENEFRIVAVPKSEDMSNRVFCDISQCLKTIILGDAFPKVYLPTIQALANKLNVPYRKLHWEQDSYILLQWKTQNTLTPAGEVIDTTEETGCVNAS